MFFTFVIKGKLALKPSCSASNGGAGSDADSIFADRNIGPIALGCAAVVIVSKKWSLAVLYSTL